ncbi:hypothetical protein K1719_002108 [Acacia pycnantha]|nr:hypothetical protein K1719_002108 [Acacia pycnantha]
MLEVETAWVDQLPYVLWGIRTTTHTSTKETPYRLTYGCESMIPFEIGLPSWRRRNILSQGETANSEALLAELDLVDEVRVTVHCRDIAAKQLIAARYNKRVRPRSFQLGDLVLRRADIRNKNAKDSKLATNWDGPYRIHEALEKGAYILETLDKSIIKRTWNADKLRAYYIGGRCFQRTIAAKTSLKLLRGIKRNSHVVPDQVKILGRFGEKTEPGLRGSRSFFSLLSLYPGCIAIQTGLRGSWGLHEGDKLIALNVGLEVMACSVKLDPRVQNLDLGQRILKGLLHGFLQQPLKSCYLCRQG